MRCTSRKACFPIPSWLQPAPCPPRRAPLGAALGRLAVRALSAAAALAGVAALELKVLAVLADKDLAAAELGVVEALDRGSRLLGGLKLDDAAALGGGEVGEEGQGSRGRVQGITRSQGMAAVPLLLL